MPEMQTCNLCFYLSDHGFGHIARNLPIIAEAARRTSGLLYLVCGARHLAFAKENLREMLSPTSWTGFATGKSTPTSG